MLDRPQFRSTLQQSASERMPEEMRVKAGDAGHGAESVHGVLQPAAGMVTEELCGQGVESDDYFIRQSDAYAGSSLLSREYDAAVAPVHTLSGQAGRVTDAESSVEHQEDGSVGALTDQRSAESVAGVNDGRNLQTSQWNDFSGAHSSAADTLGRIASYPPAPLTVGKERRDLGETHVDRLRCQSLESRLVAGEELNIPVLDEFGRDTGEGIKITPLGVHGHRRQSSRFTISEVRFYGGSGSDGAGTGRDDAGLNLHDAREAGGVVRSSQADSLILAPIDGSVGPDRAAASVQARWIGGSDGAVCPVAAVGFEHGSFVQDSVQRVNDDRKPLKAKTVCSCA
jgi:hypothetical protein